MMMQCSAGQGGDGCPLDDIIERIGTKDSSRDGRLPVPMWGNALWRLVGDTGRASGRSQSVLRSYLNYEAARGVGRTLSWAGEICQRLRESCLRRIPVRRCESGRCVADTEGGGGRERCMEMGNLEPRGKMEIGGTEIGQRNHPKFFASSDGVDGECQPLVDIRG